MIEKFRDGIPCVMTQRSSERDFEKEPPGVMTQRSNNGGFEKELLELGHKERAIEKFRERTTGFMKQRMTERPFE
jgi:hypothetical protein